MGILLFDLTHPQAGRDLKASVPRCKRQRTSKVKTVRRTVFSESVDRRSDRRGRSEDEADGTVKQSVLPARHSHPLARWKGLEGERVKM